MKQPKREVPEDAVTEILLRLPAKSLTRFKSVSTKWCSLIKSPDFITAHHRLRRETLLLTRYLPQPETDYVFSVHDFQSDDDLDVALLRRPSLLLPCAVHDFEYDDDTDDEVDRQPALFLSDLLDPSYPSITILGHSHGIVCLWIKYPNHRFILSNPALREFKRVPSHTFRPPQGYTLWGATAGFGYDPGSNNFKIVMLQDILPPERFRSVFNGKRYLWASVYSSVSDSWSLIDEQVLVPRDGFFSDGSGPGVLFNGAYHWVAVTVIFCFEFKGEVFGHVELPERRKIVGFRSALAVVDECLAMVLYRDNVREAEEIRVWVMKEYGVKDSWTKMYVIGPRELKRPLAFLGNDWLLVETPGGHLGSSALRRRTNESDNIHVHIEGSRGSLRAMIYKESLISLASTQQ